MTILVLMAAAFLVPRALRPPDIQENRALAAKPDWPRQPQDFRAFRRAVDAYVADHFPIRPHLIGLLNLARMSVGVSGSNRMIIGRDGWMFYDDDSHLGAARNDPRMPSSEVRAWLKTLAGRSEAVRAQGAPYLIVTPPVKEAIYPNQAPSWMRVDAQRPAIALPVLAGATGAGEVLYLGSGIVDATRGGLNTYSRHDTHWTGYGAYAGYAALMSRLKAMGVTVEDPMPLSAFSRKQLRGLYVPRDLALMLGVASFVSLDYPHLEDPHAKKRITTYLTKARGWTAPQVVDTGEVGKPVLLLTRDSFANELLPYLYPHFSRIILTHVQDGFWRPDLIARYHPNIVILETLENGLRLAMGDGPPASADAAARIDAAVTEPPPPVQQAPPVVGVPPAPPAIPATSAMTSDPRVWALLNTAKPAAHCNLEVAVLVPGEDGAPALKVSGWLPELGRPNPASVGAVRLRGGASDLVGQISIDLPRPDVAEFLKNPMAEQSGFEVTLSVGKLPRGSYRPTVYRRTAGGWVSCDGPQILTAR